MRKLPHPWPLTVGIVLTLGLYAIFEALPPLVPCTDHVAQSLALALCAGMGLYLLLGGRGPWLLAGAATVVLLTVWLGFYPLSPHYKNILQGFTVITHTREMRIAPGAVISLAASDPTALQPITSIDNLHCNWMSAQGGAFDDPQSCATVYVPPPHRESDILKISIQPACGLPRVVGQIKISILP